VFAKALLISFSPFLFSLHRCFSSYDDMNLKRRTSLPLVRSQSFQLAGKEGIYYSRVVHLVSSVTVLVLYNVCVTASV